jgi:sugar/nucleoside kinase (ribokinase family)
MNSLPKIDKILVIGDIMIDTIVMPKGAMVHGSDVRAKIIQKNGGSGANQSLWLSKNKVKVKFLARVGVGDIAHYQDFFKAKNITPILIKDENLSTGHLVTLVDKKGERSFFTDRGANINLSIIDIPEDIFNNISLLHLSGYAFFEPKVRAVALELIKQAKAKNIPFSIDPASTSFLRQVGVKQFLVWSRGAALFFPNEEEATLLSGSDITEEQIKQLGLNYDLVIVKRGAKGSAVGTKDKMQASAKAKRIKAIDSTGAGDAFLGGFIGAMKQGKSLISCLEQGNEQGAIAASQTGGQP